MTVTLVLTVLAAVAVTLLIDRFEPELVLLTGLVALVLTGALPAATALEGFGRDSVITLGALFLVAGGLQHSGAAALLGRSLLKPGGRRRLVAPLLLVAVLSAFFNNTPLVAVMMPLFVDWAKRQGRSPSKFLLPLSYMAMLGGTCTLIGTSTNLIVDDMLRRVPGQAGLGMFELAWVGVPATLAGLAYLLTTGHRLLPERRDLLEEIAEDSRSYTVEMLVRPDCPLIGRSIRKAALRDLPGLFLYRLERGPVEYAPVDPQTKLHAGDVLHFVGVVSHVVDLQRIRGLVPLTHRGDGADGGGGAAASRDAFEGIPDPPVPRYAAGTPATVAVESATAALDSYEGVGHVAAAAPAAEAGRSGRQLCEVVVSPGSPLVGRRVKDSNFRSRYDASILAVHRSGHRLEEKVGRVQLEGGDTLLIDAGADFLPRWRNSPDFILVAGIEDSAPLAHEKVRLAGTVFVVTVVAMTVTTLLGGRPTFAAVVGALAMVLTGCLPYDRLARELGVRVLLLVVASLGLSQALQLPEVAATLQAWSAPLLAGAGPTLLVAGVFATTCLLSQFLSNNATAALMVGLVLATTAGADLDPRGLLVTVAVAASASFATAVGYQTNLMVRSAGGYRARDYLLVGGPLALLVGAVTVALVPWVWPL